MTNSQALRVLADHSIEGHVDAHGNLWAELLFTEYVKGQLIEGSQSERIVGSPYAWLGY
jgi:hypothetical protein